MARKLTPLPRDFKADASTSDLFRRPGRGEPLQIGLRLTDRLDDAVRQRRGKSAPVGNGGDDALQVIDFGAAAARRSSHIEERASGSIFMVRPSTIANSTSGSRSSRGTEAHRKRRGRDRPDALGRDRRQRLFHLIRIEPSPRALRQLLAQWRVGERIERVVQVEQQRVHAGDVVGDALSTRPRESFSEVAASSRSITMSPDVAR